jgi:threonine/homoserine/homoserine lactone efflux protein
MTMSLFLTGIVLGLVVSVPPGPNAALCINLACDGVRRAVPVITYAALADAAYSLLAASGVLLVAQAGAGVLSWLTPFFLFATAALAWSPASISPRTAGGVALLNPATVAIWLSISSVPEAQAPSVSDLLLRPLPVALGTAAWFTLLALTASRLSSRLSPGATGRAQRALAAALALAGAISLVGAIS